MKNAIWMLCCCVLLAAAPEPQDPTYKKGKDALKQHQWAEATRLFQKVADGGREPQPLRVEAGVELGDQ